MSNIPIMDLKCLCNNISHIPNDVVEPEDQEKQSESDKVQTRIANAKCYQTKINFGCVAVGKRSTRAVYIRNDSDKIQLYRFAKTPESNLICNVFDCSILCKKKLVKPNDIFQCKVTFTPAIPKEKSFYKFVIIDNSYNKHIIDVQGTSIGPKVQASAKLLSFFIIKNATITKRFLEITNSSSVETMYQFEMNNDIFKVDEAVGQLHARDKRLITVQFCPKQQGVFAEKLWCLIQHQEPISVELYGVFQPDKEYNTRQVAFKKYPIPLEYRTGINGYLENISHKKDALPVTLSQQYLFFDDSNTLTSLMENHINEIVRVQWLQEKNSIFQISPEAVVIPPGAIFTFSCKFFPQLPNKIYSKILTAQVYCYSESHIENQAKIVDTHNIIHVPLTLALNCGGHSFEKNFHWMSMIDVTPSVIVLPACTKDTTASTTLTIKSTGRLPALFRIVPPKKTSVSMKPMAGVIEAGHSRIVVVQFAPTPTETSFINEEWKICLNGQNDQRKIFLKGQCSVPSLIIGDNNRIRFPCVQIGWKEVIFVLLKNISIFEIKYTFSILNNEYLEIEPMEGYIAANQEFYIKMFYTGDLCAPEKTELVCHCEVVQKGLIIGRQYKTVAIVYTQCAQAQLCALPSAVDFGEIKWNTPLKTSFQAFNFGTPPVNFELKSNAKGINFAPTSGRIDSGQKLTVTVELVAKTIGENKVILSYSVLGSSNADNVEVFTIHFICRHPVIQIEEIADHNMGHLFSKAILWNLLNIDQINRILRNMKHDEKETIVCHVPDFEMSGDLHYVDFLLTNKTNFRMDVVLKRKKMCNCEAAEMKSLTFRKKVYNCPHREMLNIKVPQTSMAPKSKGSLRLEIKYIEPDQNKLCYIVELTDNRFIEIIVLINSITTEVSTLSAYKPSCQLDLRDVFIGEMYPALQSFWLYNNSSHSVTYHIDPLELTKLNNSEGFEILRCLNPVDIVEAYDSRPIMFRFQPIEAKFHAVAIPLLLGDKLVELKIRGRGVTNSVSNPISISPSMPSFSQTILNSINISVDDVLVENLPVWSCTERIIFIRNNTSDRIYEYDWSDLGIEGVLNITASQKEGLLQPKETCRVHIRIQSLGEPCITHVVLSCKFHDYSQFLLHEQSKIEYEKKKEEVSQFFTITENEIIYPVVEQNIVPPPEDIYINVGINVKIISTLDLHIHCDMEDILKNKPRNTLPVDVEKIMKNYEERMTETDPPIQSLAFQEHEKKMKLKKEKEKEEDEEMMDENLAEIISDTITLLIGEIVFSETFKYVIETEEADVDNYYCQYKLEGGYGSKISQDPSRRVKMSDQRVEETEKFLNYPQVQELSCTMKQMLNEALNTTFGEQRSASLFSIHEDNERPF